jgi:hypothetical protein
LRSRRFGGLGFGSPRSQGDRSARALDLLARAGGEEVRGHGQLLRQLAVPEDLDVEPRVPDQGLLP